MNLGSGLNRSLCKSELRHEKHQIPSQARRARHGEEIHKSRSSNCFQRARGDAGCGAHGGSPRSNTRSNTRAGARQNHDACAHSRSRPGEARSRACSAAQWVFGGLDDD